MHTTNYVDTLIRPAEDCRVVAKVPDKPGSVAALQYDLMAGNPYRMTSDEVLSTVAARRQGIGDADFPAFVDAFFSRGQACFRASPLTKTHGWAVHADQHGRIALISPASPDYDRLEADAACTKVSAMRAKRA